MKLFKISALILYILIINSVRTNQIEENESDLDESIQKESSDSSDIESGEIVPEGIETKENECNESVEQQPANECNEIESSGKVASDGTNNGGNDGNGSFKEQEEKVSDTKGSFKDEVEDAIDDVADFIKNILKCRLSMPGFRQCVMAGTATAFKKTEASGNPIPTAPPPQKPSTENATEFPGYSLKDWIKFVASKDAGESTPSFAAVSLQSSLSSVFDDK